MQKNAILEKVEEFYQEGIDLAYKDLNPCNPVRLALALNYTVHFHEQRNDTLKAIKLTCLTLEEALGHIDDADQQNFSDAETLIKMLKENLVLWKEEQTEIRELETEKSVSKIID